MACACHLSAGKLLRCYSVTMGAKSAGLQPRLSDVRRDMIRARRVITIEAARRVTDFFAARFERQVEAVIEEATKRLSKKAAEDRRTIYVNLGQHEAVWAAVIEEVLGPGAHVELVEAYTPMAQSVIARSYEKTCIFFGEEKAHDASLETLRRAKDTAQKVTRIDDTTKLRLKNTIEKAVQEGASTSDVARAIRDNFDTIAKSRLPTIARTEVGRLLDEGVKQAVKESSVVATVDVIGCKAVEPGIPTYGGRPTCNITGVPARDVDKLEFHINHTGAIVAGSFWE